MFVSRSVSDITGGPGAGADDSKIGGGLSISLQPNFAMNIATNQAKIRQINLFESLQPREVVSFRARPYERSQRVMQRLGMTHSPLDDFEHPMLPVGHSLRPHVLSRIQKSPGLLERLNRDLT